jgi:trimeric autotransporter adhesin
MHQGAFRLATAAFLLQLCSTIGFAQTVTPPSTPANCVQNVGNSDFACGSGSVAQPGTGTMAIGVNAKANGDAATAVGAGATATSISATSFGQGAAATSTGAIAIGQGAQATGTSAVGIGFAGRGLAARAVGIGEVATASGTDSTALGANTSAGFVFSTALGANAQATAANQMMFGTATNILAAPGIVSAASKAAQKGKVLMVTVDANGNLATAAVPVCRCRPIIVTKKPPPKRR